jgi:hypothetical protein
METPNIIDRWLHVGQYDAWGTWWNGVERRYVGRYGMSPKIIVIHIQEGNNWGSWQHFHSVTASSTVFVGKNGDIWRLVPESDAPWTNGDVMSPTAKGREIINKWGADPNFYTLSIETEGYTGEFPKSEAQMNSVVWQVKQWQALYNIDKYYIVRHADLNQVTRPNCPGDAYFEELMRRLDAAAPAPVPAVYAVPKKLYDVKGRLIDGTFDAVLANGTYFHADKRTITAAVDGVQPHLYATRTSAFTRTTMTAGEKTTALGWVTGERVGDDERWWITKYFSRIDVNGTIEKPDETDDHFDNPDFPPNTRLVDGVLYFPVQSNGKPYRNLKVERNANMRAKPTTNSSVVGVVRPDQYVRAAYWCMGEEVADNRAWWVIDIKRDGSDPLKTGAYLWVEATYSQPSDTYGQ